MLNNTYQEKEGPNLSAYYWENDCLFYGLFPNFLSAVTDIISGFSVWFGLVLCFVWVFIILSRISRSLKCMRLIFVQMIFQARSPSGKTLLTYPFSNIVFIVIFTILYILGKCCLFFLRIVLLLQQHFNRSGPSVLKTKYWTTIVDNYMTFKASIQCVSTGLKYVY